MLDAIGEVALRFVKRPWVGVAVCVLVCAALAAQAVGHVIEARYLGPSQHAPNISRVEVAAPAPARVIDRGAQGSALVTRDMFCSDCTPVVIARPSGGAADDDGHVPLTSLPLVLVATSLGHEPVATVRDDKNGSQGAYVVGQPLPGAGEITRIGATYVDFVNPQAVREERVSLLAIAKTESPPPPGAPPPAADPYAERIRKVDDTRYEVDRGLVRELVGAAGKPLPGMRMMPMSKDGKLSGVKVLSSRADSLAAALGLKSGDQLAAVNGVAIDSVDKMLEVYTKLDNLNVVTIDGTRDGKPISWQYDLR